MKCQRVTGRIRCQGITERPRSPDSYIRKNSVIFFQFEIEFFIYKIHTKIIFNIMIRVRLSNA